jgi:hypothetical protein
MTIIHSLKSEQQYKELSDIFKAQGSTGIPLWYHAEMWWYEQGKDIPERDTDDWQKMYESWIEFAFADFAEVKE